MKLVGITLNTIYIKSYKEKRDSLNQKLIEFLIKCNLLPVLIPNNFKTMEGLIEKITFEGFVLSGGNDLIKYGGTDLEREKIENFLIDFSIENNLSLLGICRGMQAIQNHFGQQLYLLNNHVGKRHKVKFYNETIVCNSYHNLGTKNPITCFQNIAVSEDLIIEGIKHNNHNIYGIMWHPERTIPFETFDISFVKKIFNI